MRRIIYYLIELVFALWHSSLGVATATIQYLIYLFLANHLFEYIALLVSIAIAIMIQFVYVTYQVYDPDDPKTKVKDIIVYYLGYSIAIMYIPVHFICNI